MNPARTVLIGLVQVYRLAISPVLPRACRFFPSCSEYAVQALERHGALAGTYLAARRVCRCHPWHDGGIDEVPLQRPRLFNWAGSDGSGGPDGVCKPND